MNTSKSIHGELAVFASEEVQKAVFLDGQHIPTQHWEDGMPTFELGQRLLQGKTARQVADLVQKFRNRELLEHIARTDERATVARALLKTGLLSFEAHKLLKDRWPTQFKHWSNAATGPGGHLRVSEQVELGLTPCARHSLKRDGIRATLQDWQQADEHGWVRLTASLRNFNLAEYGIPLEQAEDAVEVFVQAARHELARGGTHISTPHGSEDWLRAAPGGVRRILLAALDYIHTDSSRWSILPGLGGLIAQTDPDELGPFPTLEWDLTEGTPRYYKQSLRFFIDIWSEKRPLSREELSENLDLLQGLGFAHRTADVHVREAVHVDFDGFQFLLAQGQPWPYVDVSDAEDAIMAVLRDSVMAPAEKLDLLELLSRTIRVSEKDVVDAILQHCQDFDAQEAMRLLGELKVVTQGPEDPESREGLLQFFRERIFEFRCPGRCGGPGVFWHNQQMQPWSGMRWTSTAGLMLEVSEALAEESLAALSSGQDLPDWKRHNYLSFQLSRNAWPQQTCVFNRQNFAMALPLLRMHWAMPAGRARSMADDGDESLVKAYLDFLESLDTEDPRREECLMSARRHGLFTSTRYGLMHERFAPARPGLNLDRQGYKALAGIFSDEFGDDSTRWQVACDLLTDWEGTIPELVGVVHATSG